jgi:hypothetical protein
MDAYDEAMFDDLGFDEAEGAADTYDEYDEMDEADAYDEGDEGDAYDEGDEGDEFSGFDEMDAGDEMDEYDAHDEGEESAETGQAWDEALGFALAAEDTDEFLRRIARGVTRVAQVARRVAPVVGRIARAAAPVARLIPGPWGVAARAATSVLGQLRADEASEDEALEAFAELAVRTPALLPIAAGLATRRVLGPAAARMPAAQRVQAVRTVRQAATRMVASGGPTAARALPRIARSVQRTSATRHTPPSVRPRVLARTAARAAAPGTRLGRQLTRPLPAGNNIVRRARAAVRAGGSPARIGGRHHHHRRRMYVRGPVYITIR